MGPDPKETADLFKFVQKILNEKLHFLGSDVGKEDLNKSYSAKSTWKFTSYPCFDLIFKLDFSIAFSFSCSPDLVAYFLFMAKAYCFIPRILRLPLLFAFFQDYLKYVLC